MRRKKEKRDSEAGLLNFWLGWVSFTRKEKVGTKAVVRIC